MFPYFRSSRAAQLLRDVAVGTLAGGSFVGIPFALARATGRI